MLIFDIETTHFSKDKGHIVEVGIVRLDLGNGAREILYDRVVNEVSCTFDQIYGCWFWENSDITLRDIVEAWDFEKELPRIQKIIDQDPDGITAYNAPFDFGWLESRGILFPCKMPDPMKI